jgi:hypothetical protein
MEEAHHVLCNPGKRRSPSKLAFDIGQKAFSDLAARGNDLPSAKEAPVDAGQNIRVLIRQAAEHDAVHMGKMGFCLVKGGDAAIEHDLERLMIALQPIDALIVQRRDGAILLGRETLEPGLARVNDQRGAACARDRGRKAFEPFLLILFVDADAAFDGDRNRHGGTHRGQTFADAAGLGHETGAEATFLHAIGGTAAVEIDLTIAKVLADAGGECEFGGIGAAKLQGDRLLQGREGQKLFPAAELDCGRGHHLGIEQRPTRDGAVEGTAVPVRPVHHRGDGKDFFFIFQQFMLHFNGLKGEHNWTK